MAEQERARIQDLLPIRHERMAASPFAFYRAGAAVMAADLAPVPVTGIFAQLGGDAHLENFGIFATPERNLVFDLNDFDETLPGPWEWDVMRLCASVPLAAGDAGLRGSAAADAVFSAAESYRRTIRRFAKSSPLDVWYARLDVDTLARGSGDRADDWRRAIRQAEREPSGGRFVSGNPYFRRLDPGDPIAIEARAAMKHYAASVFPSVRVLLERYELADLALKVVGVGSVGTLCMAALMLSNRGDQLVLQLKEAQASVLEAYLPHSRFANHGQRVVNGQHLMQAASDVFLGWVRFGERDFYVRQLADRKASVDLSRVTAPELADYAASCGWTLARAHARSGDGAAIAAYLGKSDEFAEAMVRFANSYAACVERDYEAFVASLQTPRSL